MRINRNTRISKLINQNPAALDAIAGIHPRFEKLRNPALRKLMACRTSIAMAARVGGCAVDDFFSALEPLGFTTDRSTTEENAEQALQKPAFINDMPPAHIIELDVRPVLEKGTDPLNIIMERVQNLKDDQVLKIINTFEPSPLIAHLKKQGFSAGVEHTGHNEVITWFYKTALNGITDNTAPDEPAVKTGGWDEIMNQYRNRLEEIDVRGLEMPGPMMTILEALETLPAEKALFVYHKRIPLFLLPELQQRLFDYRIQEVSEGVVHMLIFKPANQ